MKRTFSVIAVALVMAAMLAVMAAPAFAKIAPASCTTSGGGTPPGQQPTCTGGGLEQNPATNPAGQAPPGQQ